MKPGYRFTKKHITDKKPGYRFTKKLIENLDVGNFLRLK